MIRFHVKFSKYRLLFFYVNYYDIIRIFVPKLEQKGHFALSLRLGMFLLKYESTNSGTHFRNYCFFKGDIFEIIDFKKTESFDPMV